jgi:hypothetical protein
MKGGRHLLLQKMHARLRVDHLIMYHSLSNIPFMLDYRMWSALT